MKIKAHYMWMYSWEPDSVSYNDNPKRIAFLYTLSPRKYDSQFTRVLTAHYHQFSFARLSCSLIKSASLKSWSTTTCRG